MKLTELMQNMSEEERNELLQKLRNQWDLLTDEDIKDMGSEEQKFTTVLQRVYQYSAEEADVEVDRFMKGFHIRKKESAGFEESHSYNE